MSEPKNAPYADVRKVMKDAVTVFIEEVSSGTFPGPEHTFHETRGSE